MNTCFLIQKHAECTERFFTSDSLPTDSLVHRGDFVLAQCSLVFITLINMRVMIQSSDVSPWLPSWHLLFVQAKLIVIIYSLTLFQTCMTIFLPWTHKEIFSWIFTLLFFPSWPGGQVLKRTISTRKPNNNTVKVVQTIFVEWIILFKLSFMKNKQLSSDELYLSHTQLYRV